MRPWLQGSGRARTKCAQQVCCMCQEMSSRRGAGLGLGPPGPHPHTPNFQLNKTQALVRAPAKRMRAQLHSIIVISVYISAVITGILDWFTVVTVEPGLAQGHRYARHLKNSDSLKRLHPKGASFSLRTA